MPPSQKTHLVKAGWWIEFFDKRVAETILAELRPNELDFLTSTLELTPGQSIFDQCCGWGRVAGPLAQQGYSVWGVEASPELLCEATRKWNSPNLNFSLADATEHEQTPLCDVGLNLYSSFGYSEDQNHNQRMLEQLVGAVKPGGKLLLDTINPDRVYAQFQSTFTQKSINGTTIVRESELRNNGRSLHQIWHFEFPDGQGLTRRGITWLYSRRELEEMLLGSGCQPQACFSDLFGKPHSPEGERLILVAQK